MYRIAVIGGDGTGPEVAAEGLKVLHAVAEREGFPYQTEAFDYGGDRYLRTGSPMPADGPERLKAFQAIFLGAVGRPDIQPGIIEKELLLRLRFELGQYINLRPVKLYPGVVTPLRDKGPDDIDFVVVRENNEDLYVGAGGFIRKGTPEEVAIQESINTRAGVERCIRYAFAYCRKRHAAAPWKQLTGAERAKGYRGQLTLVAKTNVLTYAHDLWMRTFEAVSRDYPDVKTDYNHVDACCMWMIKSPEQYDVIVTTNMFGDIITDLAAMLQGGLGVAAGGNINPHGVSMFEPMGGSAPKYAGQGRINPIAAIMAVMMMLDFLGEERAARRVERAVAQVTPRMTGMAAGQMGFSTSEVGDLVVQALDHAGDTARAATTP